MTGSTTLEADVAQPRASVRFPLPLCLSRHNIYCNGTKEPMPRDGHCRVLLVYDGCPRGHTIYPGCSHRDARFPNCSHPSRVGRNEYGAYHTCLQHLTLEICPEGRQLEAIA